MIKLLKKYDRWHDFFNIKEPEVYLSIFFTIIVLFVINEIDMYRCFASFLDVLQNILLYLSAGMMGLIGVALSGVAIITGLFSKRTVEIIEKRSGKGIFEKIMSSFLFIAFSCAIYVFYVFILILIINSSKPIATLPIFYVIVAFTTYFAFFNILYAVCLVGNCIKVFAIRNKYDEIKEKDFFEVANEFRIDYILKSIVEKYDITENELLQDLEDIVNRSDIKNKEELINYYYSYYSGKRKK